MTPTATAPTETKTETVTFIAKCSNQVLTRRQARHVDNGMGGRETLGEQEWMERQREKGEPFDETPWRAEFVNSVFSSDNPGLIKWLRRHRLFETSNGFWEMGAAPDEPKPTVTEQMTKVAEASVDADIDVLQEVLEQEKQTHDRAPIKQAAEAALRRFADRAPEPGADASADDNGGSKSTSANSQPD